MFIHSEVSSKKLQGENIAGDFIISTFYKTTTL